MEEQYFTKEGLEKIKKELEKLKNIKRPQIAKRLRESAAFGDLSENAEYQEAKVAQSFIEGRILELEEALRNAIIIDEERKTKTVQLGSKIKLASGHEKYTFIIVGASEAAPEEGKISDESPLGRALLGKREGDVVEINTPQGKVQYKIIMV